MDTGAVYLYQIEDNGSISFLSKITAPDSATGDTFASSISLSENQLVVGACLSDPDGQLNAGSSYSFDIGKLANRTPTDLGATSSLTIAENQPIGSIVGQFNATDPDTNSTLTYHIVNGVGDGNFIPNKTLPSRQTEP